MSPLSAASGVSKEDALFPSLSIHVNIAAEALEASIDSIFRDFRNVGIKKKKTLSHNQKEQCCTITDHKHLWNYFLYKPVKWSYKME